MEPNQNPEQQARDNIDKQLQQAGWIVQEKTAINFGVAKAIAIKEYQTLVGPVDYALFIDRKPVGLIEAKKESEGHRITVVEEQSGEYATSGLKYFEGQPIYFIYESTGEVTKFRDARDPKPRSRRIFQFHRPETLEKWLKRERSFRDRLRDIPDLVSQAPVYMSMPDDKPTDDEIADSLGLRLCQYRAINNLENSFKEYKPRALVQMATGSGKTYTAITAIYRLLKYAKADRILFLVDTKNLGEQAEQEFMAYTPTDDNRKFTELYNVQRLTSSYISPDSQVVITTIQRLYSILKGEELETEAEEENPNERMQPKEPLPVVYNEKIPPEFFDVMIIDECHRSIYNLWRQVLDYFDSFMIGLTATPDTRTFAFFHENVVSEYSHEDAVADGVNVGYDVYTIETKITSQGAKLEAEELVEKRERLSRRKRWEQLDEDVAYTKKQLDKDVVNLSVIRNVIKTFKQKLPEIFPKRTEIPKTLIFAKTDSHADDIIQIVREEFGEGNEFCKKITYNAQEDPKSVLAQFRNEYNPRIAVTVDMVATGTDVRPLECLLFMRDVKSRNYFEQMKGRGTRTQGYDDLKKVTPSAITAKTHFVIVDAIGVTKSLKTDSRPLERKPTMPLKDLMQAAMMGAGGEDEFTSLANRLARLEKQLTPKEKEEFTGLAGGTTINQLTHSLLNAFDPDKIEEKVAELLSSSPEKGRWPEGPEGLMNLPELKSFRKFLRKNLTPAEAALWRLLKGKQLDGRKFRRQHSVDKYILDFYCPAERLAVELDGEVHNSISAAEYDHERDLFLNAFGIKVLRFENKEVFENQQGLLDAIGAEFGWFKNHPAFGTPPYEGGELRQQAQQQLKQQAIQPINGKLIEYTDKVRKAHEQIMDEVNIDEVKSAGWDVSAKEKAMHIVQDFRQFMEDHKDEITALRIFYEQPYQRREVTYRMIKDLRDVLLRERPALAPMHVWQAYEQLEKMNGQSPKNELTALVALVRHICGIDGQLMPYEQTVNENFRQWVFKKNAGQHNRFTDEQMEWLRMIRDHVITSFHFEPGDLDYAPFDAKGGIGRMYQLFGDEMDEIINELNEALAA